MALPRQYARQACSMARALEIVGERWTLLIIRDALFGVRRFTDFAAHLDIPRAVLAERLAFLVGEGVLDRVPSGGREEYLLTDKGQALWPAVRALLAWGDEFYSPAGPGRLFRHVACDAIIGPDGRCPACDLAPAAADLEMLAGPGQEARRTDPISMALRGPHQLLTPLA
jgi:DNA-binding HxlR family transcriptional regulator